MEVFLKVKTGRGCNDWAGCARTGSCVGANSTERLGRDGPMNVRLIEGDALGLGRLGRHIYSRKAGSEGWANGFLRSTANQVKERISAMVRISLSVSAVALALLASGCTFCETCDDFPMPCNTGNCGVAMTSAPITPFLGSYTPLRAPETTQAQPAAEPAAPAGAVVPPGMSSAPALPDENPNPTSPDAPGVAAPNITTPPTPPAATPDAGTPAPSAEPTAPAADAPKTSQINLETDTNPTLRP